MARQILQRFSVLEEKEEIVRKRFAHLKEWSTDTFLNGTEGIRGPVLESLIDPFDLELSKKTESQVRDQRTVPRRHPRSLITNNNSLGGKSPTYRVNVCSRYSSKQKKTAFGKKSSVKFKRRKPPPPRPLARSTASLESKREQHAAAWAGAWLQTCCHQKGVEVLQSQRKKLIPHIGSGPVPSDWTISSPNQTG
jgi:hypothetical protein